MPTNELSTDQEVKTMEVPVDKLQAVMDKMEGFETALKEKDAQIEALNQTVSATRLAEAKANLDVDKRPRVHFKKIDGKTVVGWAEGPGPDVKNEVIFNPATNMPVGEVLKSTFYFADGTDSGLIDQIKLTRSTEQSYARIVKDDGEYVVVEFEDQEVATEPMRIKKVFLNA